MLVNYIKKTGQVVASYPEYYGEAPYTVVREDGKVTLTSEDLGTVYLMPREAKRYIDPRKDKYDIHKCKVIIKNNEPMYLYNPQTKKKITFTSKEDLKEHAELWQNLYTGVKFVHPDLKFEEGLKLILS